MEERIIDEKMSLHRNLRFLQKAVFAKFVEFATANLPPNLSAGEHRLLMYVGDHEGCLSVDIANAFYLRKSTISPMVNSLVKKGFLKIEKVGSDKRKLPIYLTETGKKAYEVAGKKFMEFDRQIEKDISKEDLDNLYKVYHKIEKNLKEVKIK